LNSNTEHELIIRYYLSENPNLEGELDATEKLNNKLLEYKSKKGPSEQDIDNETATLEHVMCTIQQFIADLSK